MEKKNIIIGVIALLLVVSVGYALFSDTLNINGTASAKGDFNLTTTCFTGVASELNGSGVEFASEAGYNTDSCEVNDNTVTFYTNLEYPTSRRYFTIKVENTGSIAAFTENFNIVTKMITNGKSKSCLYKTEDDSLVRCLPPNSGDATNSRTKFVLNTSDGGLTEIEPLDPVTLNPGDSFYIVYGVTWPAVFSGTNYKSGYYIQLTRSATVDFVQKN